jgi:hypothetical protein
LHQDYLLSFDQLSAISQQSSTKQKMKPLHKLGEYHNLDKLNKIATDSCYTTKYFATHNNIHPLYDTGEDSPNYASWGTTGVNWHTDDIYKGRKYSIILVVQSDNYELYSSTVNNNTLEKLLKNYTPFKSMDDQINSLLVPRKDTQRLVLKAGDILLLDISCYHKLKNTKKTEDPFIFINLDIDFIPKVKEAVKVVNYFVYDFFCNY